MAAGIMPENAPRYRPAMEIAPFRIEQWYERFEFAAELMLSSSDCETVTVADLIGLERDAGERLHALRLGYTEVPGSPEARTAVAGLYETVDPDGDVLVVAAAQEAIFLLLHAVLRPGDHVVVETPCYESPLTIARSAGATVDAWARRAEDGWAYDVEALAALLRPETRLVYVNTPHNPTGSHMTRAELDAVAALCAERDIILFCDEVYRELEHDPADRLPAACDLYERAVSLGSISKAYGLPGLRLGWLASRDRDLLRAVSDLKLYTSICSSAPSELLVALALRYRDGLVARNRALVLENLARVEAFRAAHPGALDWVPPRAGPIGFPRVGVVGAGDVRGWCERLVAEQGVLLLPGDVYDAPAHVRVGLGRVDVPAALERLSVFVRSG
jgi:aspartate/methionine/tyrosine aminotransferase